MNQALRKDADRIISASLKAVPPGEAVRRALKDLHPEGGRTPLVSAGKAAWQMAKTAADTPAMWTARPWPRWSPGAWTSSAYCGRTTLITSWRP